jgi:hypothetical protein
VGRANVALGIEPPLSVTFARIGGRRRASAGIREVSRGPADSTECNVSPIWIEDTDERLRSGLAQLDDYYQRTERMMANLHLQLVIRDAMRQSSAP